MKRVHNLRPKISSNITLLPCLTDAVYGRDYSDTDTDDKNSPDVIEIVLFFLSGNECDTETWTRSLTLFAR